MEQAVLGLVAHMLAEFERISGCRIINVHRVEWQPKPLLGARHHDGRVGWHDLGYFYFEGCAQLLRPSARVPSERDWDVFNANETVAS